MPAVLEKEYKVYLSHLNKFIPAHQNKYVLIKGDKVVGFYGSYKEALRAGLKSFGNVPFFIKVVKKTEEVHFFHQGIMSSNG